MSTPASRSRSTCADRDAGHPLHHHHFGAAVVPVHGRDEQQRRMLEVAAQLRAVRRLAREVELVAQRLLELGDDGARPQPLAVGPQLLEQHRAGVHQRDVLLDHLGDVRPQHLDGDRRAVRQLGEMHLRDRRARDRRRVERAEHLLDRLAVERGRASPSTWSKGNGGTRSCSFASSSAMSAGSRSRRVDSIWPNLTKIGPSSSQREPQPHRARRRGVAPERERARRAAAPRGTARGRSGTRRART